MTTAHPTVPNFPSTKHGHPAVRAAVILGLCLSLVAGFVATSSQGPGSGRAAAQSTSVACDAIAAARHAC